MTNEVNQDAEESATIEKTAEDTQESTTTTAAEAEASPETAASEPGTTEQGETPSPEPADEAAAATAEGAGAPSVAEEPQEPVAAGEDTTGTSASAEAAPEAAPAAGTAPAEPTIRIRTVPAPPKPAAAAPAPATASAAEPAADEPQSGGDIDFGAILEQFEQEQTTFHQGELVEGKIVGITDRGVLVDFGYKSEGFVPVEEFTGPGGEMLAVVGEPVEVTIRSMHGDGAPQLSRIDALGRKVWDEIEAAYNSETPVTGRVVDKTKGGLRVDINGVEAFLPGSQIDSRPIRGLDSYIGQDIEAQVIKFSRRRNNIVLSRKVITDKVVGEQKAETLGRIEVGHIIDGTIKNLTEYGAFVDIGGIDGLLHVTDMSWGRIAHPADQFKVGEHIQVKVLKLDREREKVSLGYKQLLPDPWSTVVEVYPVNTKLTGTVSSVTDYGVFVELEPGVEGLVHVSEISWSRRAQSPKRLFHKGQQVEVQVLGVDTVEKRISLGMKQFQENPWDTVDFKYPVGTKVTGRVRNLTDFGAFIELEEGIDGLVHISDISWAKKIKHPKDVLKKDQEVEAIVTSIDKRGQRLSLSMKDLTPSAWEGFVATHRPGDVVRGKVSRFTNFGVFVELGEGLEGLCHISELSDERVDRPESVAELGQEMDFKILRIEPVEQKIGLSHRAVGKDDEPVVDTKMYSTEAKGGMASLGELAKLKRDVEETPQQEDPEEKKKAKQAAKEAKAKEFAAKEAEAAAEAERPAEETQADAEPVAEAPAETSEADNAPAAEESAATTVAVTTGAEESAETGSAVVEHPDEAASESQTEAAGTESEAVQAEAPVEGETAEAESEPATAAAGDEITPVAQADGDPAPTEAAAEGNSAETTTDGETATVGAAPDAVAEGQAADADAETASAAAETNANESENQETSEKKSA